HRIDRRGQQPGSILGRLAVIALAVAAPAGDEEGGGRGAEAGCGECAPAAEPGAQSLGPVALFHLCSLQLCPRWERRYPEKRQHDMTELKGIVSNFTLLPAGLAGG